MRSTLSPTLTLWSILIAAASTQGAPILSAEPAPGGLSQTFPAGRGYQAYPPYSKRHLEGSKLASLEPLSKRVNEPWIYNGPSKQGDGGAKKPQGWEDAVKQMEDNRKQIEDNRKQMEDNRKWIDAYYEALDRQLLGESSRSGPTEVGGKNKAASQPNQGYGSGYSREPLFAHDVENGRPLNLPEEEDEDVRYEGSTNRGRPLKQYEETDEANWSRYSRAMEKKPGEDVFDPAKEIDKID